MEKDTHNSNNIPEDTRDKLWSELEHKIQISAINKDNVSLLPEKYKTYLGIEKGFKIYEVDGPWIHNNLSVIFGHGGHGYVHEFIPHDEIWIAKTHHNCKCETDIKKELSYGYFKSTILHEITEYLEMKKGKTYWTAHNIALNAERNEAYLIAPKEIL